MSMSDQELHICRKKHFDLKFIGFDPSAPKILDLVGHHPEMTTLHCRRQRAGQFLVLVPVVSEHWLLQSVDASTP
jgi:hypothetical protein